MIFNPSYELKKVRINGKKNKKTRVKSLVSIKNFMSMNIMVMAALWNEVEMEELILLRERMMIQERQKLLSSSLDRPMSSL